MIGVKAMIYKEKRVDGDCFDLKIIDKFGNVLTMTVGGNLDLYWIVQKNVHHYTIEKGDNLIYDEMVRLFNNVKKDDVYGCLSQEDSLLTYYSEDVPLENADMLQIKRNADCFEFHFTKNETPSPMTLFKRQPNICFCNSGSNVPRVEFHFMMMFNQLAYYNENILIKYNTMEDHDLSK